MSSDINPQSNQFNNNHNHINLDSIKYLIGDLYFDAYTQIHKQNVIIGDMQSKLAKQDNSPLINDLKEQIASLQKQIRELIALNNEAEERLLELKKNSN